jgi:TolA-binding protein
MKLKSLLFVMMFILTSLAWAQTASTQTPPSSGSGAQTAPGSSQHMRAERRENMQKMMEMRKQHMEAMKADLEKLKASLEHMKANMAKIKDAAEKERWQANVDMWQVMVGHMEEMMKHMDSMGPGMDDKMGGMGPGKMRHHGMGAPPSTPPTEKKPQ